MLYYEELVDNFNNELEHTLRRHHSSVDFLSLWVPNPDHQKSIVNMIDAAKQEGQDQLSLYVSFQTLPKTAIDDLCQLLSMVGNTSVTFNEKGTIIAISHLQETQHSNNFIEDKLAIEFIITAQDNDIIDMPDFFKKNVLHYANNARYIFLERDKTSYNLSVNLDDTYLYAYVDKDTHIVKKIAYLCDDNLLMQGVLEALCTIALNVPLAELIEHGVLKTIYFLLRNNDNVTIKGVILPQNCGKEFLTLRDVLKKLPIVTDINIFDRAPSEYWMSISLKNKITLIEAECAAFCLEQQLAKHDIKVLSIKNDLSQWPIRVFIEFDKHIAAHFKPNFIRALEKHVKQHIESSLQIYHIELKDKSAIRRL